MRRPLNWFVFCLSLTFLFANLSFGRKPAPFVSQVAPPMTAPLSFSHVTVAEPTPPLFGYVRDDGSFLPLAQQPAFQTDLEIPEAHWSSATSAASKVPARF